MTWAGGGPDSDLGASSSLFSEMQVFTFPGNLALPLFPSFSCLVLFSSPLFFVPLSSVLEVFTLWKRTGAYRWGALSQRTEAVPAMSMWQIYGLLREGGLRNARQSPSCSRNHAGVVGPPACRVDRGQGRGLTACARGAEAWPPLGPHPSICLSICPSVEKSTTCLLHPRPPGLVLRPQPRRQEGTLLQGQMII